MPEQGPAGDRAAGTMAADELLAVVRVHLDRVADAVRRSGCDDRDTVEVVRWSALELVDEVEARPADPPQATGWWFARALAAAITAREAAPDGSRSPADGDPLDAALSTLPARWRVALLLRDAYDLPAAAVAAALGTDEDQALELVGRARLALPGPDADLPAPDTDRTRPGRHAGPGELTRLAEGRPVAARDATARHHVLSCVSCSARLEAQSRAVQLLAGLQVAGLPDRGRAEVLADVEERARQRLPGRPRPGSRRVTTTSAADEVTGPISVAPLPADEPPAPLLSPLLAVLSLVLAVLAGLGIGLLLSERDSPERLLGADGELPPGVRLVSPQPAAPVLPSPPTVPEQRPRTTVVVVPPSPLPPPAPPTPSPTPTPTPSAVPRLTLAPSTGPNGTEITVAGTGFPPGATVRLDYLDAAGAPTGSSAVAVTDAAGAVTATLAAQDPAAQPGPHTVVATADGASARATFTAQ